MSIYELAVATTFQDFPAGTVSGGIVVSVVGGPDGFTTPAQTVQATNAGPYSVKFDLPAGAYEAHAQLVDASGAALGALVSEAFNVVGPASQTVTLEVPASIAVTLSAL